MCWQFLFRDLLLLVSLSFCIVFSFVRALYLHTDSALQAIFHLVGLVDFCYLLDMLLLPIFCSSALNWSWIDRHLTVHCTCICMWVERASRLNGLWIKVNKRYCSCGLSTVPSNDKFTITFLFVAMRHILHIFPFNFTFFLLKSIKKNGSFKSICLWRWKIQRFHFFIYTK